MTKAYLMDGVFNQRFRVPSPSRSRSSTNVDEIPGITVIFAENLALGIVQEREKLGEETFPALL